MFQNLLENFDDIVITVGSGGSAAGIAIANYLTGSKLKYDFAFVYRRQICPKMWVNEIHALYDKHHKVSSFLKSHQNIHNSVNMNMKMTLCDAYS